MKREIKFRAWDNINNNLELDIQYLDSLNEYLHKDKYNLMQFTGLKDKNGKEIYEGDIVKRVYFPLGSNREVYEYSTIGVIEFQYNKFGMVHKFDVGEQLIPDRCMSHQKNKKEVSRHSTVGVDYFNYSIFFDKLEIIGNIYENLELL